MSLCFIYFLALFYPLSLHTFDPKFGKTLALLMLMEFIFSHSSVFFATFAFSKKLDKKIRFRIGILLGFIYLLFILSFSSSENSHFPLIAYFFLTLSRFQKFFFDKKINIRHEIYMSFAKVSCYLLTGLLALSDIFKIGHYNNILNVDSLGGDVSPLQWLNWGFLYFLLIGVISLIPFKLKSTKSGN